MKERLPKVCILISSFYPIVNGAERQAYLIARELLRDGIGVCVLTRRYEGLAPFERVDGIPVYRMPAPGNRIVASLAFTLSSLLWLNRKRKRWSILHAFQLLSPTTIAVLGKLTSGGMVVARMACSSGGGTQYGDVNRIRQAPLTGFRQRLLRHANVFVVLNEEGRRDLTEFGLGDKPVRLIPNGVDTESFCPLPQPQIASRRRALDLPVEGKLAIFVGRLNRSKGVDLLLDAWQEVLATSTEDAHLVVIGSGALRSQIEDQAHNLGQHIHLLGRRDNVVDYLQAADIFVLPSLAEGMSNALLEAMACGLPAVATSVGGTPEMVEDGANGLLVPPGNVSALSDVLLYLIRHPTQAHRFGQAARETVIARYSMEAVVDRYMKLYVSLMGLENEL